MEKGKKRKKRKRKQTPKYKTLDENHHHVKKRRRKKNNKGKIRSWVDDTACGSPTTLHVKFPFPSLRFLCPLPPPFVGEGVFL
jgi:nucleosome binding factor SPN SPT16 subunit